MYNPRAPQGCQPRGLPRFLCPQGGVRAVVALLAGTAVLLACSHGRGRLVAPPVDSPSASSAALAVEVGAFAVYACTTTGKCLASPVSSEVRTVVARSRARHVVEVLERYRDGTSRVEQRHYESATGQLLAVFAGAEGEAGTRVAHDSTLDRTPPNSLWGSPVRTTVRHEEVELEVASGDRVRAIHRHTGASVLGFGLTYDAWVDAAGGPFPILREEERLPWGCTITRVRTRREMAGGVARLRTTALEGIRTMPGAAVAPMVAKESP